MMNRRVERKKEKKGRKTRIKVLAAIIVKRARAVGGTVIYVICIGLFPHHCIIHNYIPLNHRLAMMKERYKTSTY